jgi:hypothetical protein
MQISDRDGIAQVCVAGKSREGQGLRAAWRRLNQPSVLITHHSTDLLVWTEAWTGGSINSVTWQV